MSEPRIDKNLRIGRFLLDDILRSFGGAQWFLYNISKSQMSEPLLGEIMSCLMHVDAADLWVNACGSVSYMQNPKHPTLYRTWLKDQLTRSECSELIDQVCKRAIALNADINHPFTYYRIFIFGSFLTDKLHLGDVDLGVEIHFRDGGEIPEPSYYPFRSPEPFDVASASLRPRGTRKKISLHDRRELEKIGASNRLIWTKDSGRVEGPLIAPVRSAKYEEMEQQAKDRNLKFQALIDAFSERVNSIQNWPEPPSLALRLKNVQDITRKEWLELQSNQLVLAFGHLLSLPEGKLRDELAEKLAELEFTKHKIRSAQKLSEAYVKAGSRFNPWTLRANGRLLRTATR